MKKYILITVIGILALSSIFMTLETATSGVEVSNLQKEEAELSDRKRILEGNLVTTLSASELQEKSMELGYSKPANLVYVAPAGSVARLP